jgi:hypothetical protein
MADPTLTIQVKRGLKANLPSLAAGEFALTTDEKCVYVGDGSTNVMVGRVIQGATGGDKPAAAVSGRMYYATTDHTLWLDNGSEWTQVGANDLSDLSGTLDDIDDGTTYEKVRGSVITDGYVTQLGPTGGTAGTYVTVTQARTHIDDATIHRSINDATIANTSLWSSYKIDESITAAINGLDWQDSVVDKDMTAPPSDGTVKILAGAVVDNDGNSSGTVLLPCSGHSLVAGDFVIVSGTTNYDGAYVLPTQTGGDANNIVVTATFVSETLDPPALVTKKKALVGAVVDNTSNLAGTVLLPCTGHGFDSTDVIVVSGTTNYNGTYLLPTQTGGNADNIVITHSFTAETLASPAAAVKKGVIVGARYIVASGASGDWSGKADDIAYYDTDLTWKFLTPNEGFCTRVEDEDIDYVFNGTVWVSKASGTNHNALYGLQGGGTGSDYYHLSSAEYSALTTDLSDTVEDIVGGMVSGNTETGITVTYSGPTGGVLNFSVDFGGEPGTVSSSTSGTGGTAPTVSHSDHSHDLGSHSHTGPSNGGTIDHQSLTSLPGSTGGYHLSSSDYTALTTNLSDTIEDIVGGMVSGNTETGISVTYSGPTGGVLNFVVAYGATGDLGTVSSSTSAAAGTGDAAARADHNHNLGAHAHTGPADGGTIELASTTVSGLTTGQVYRATGATGAAFGDLDCGTF